MAKIVRYIEFVGACTGAYVGAGTDYGGYMRDDVKGAERALEQYSQWRKEIPRTEIVVNFGLEDASDSAKFCVRVLFEED